jgi:hypothetical protein
MCKKGPYIVDITTLWPLVSTNILWDGAENIDSLIKPRSIDMVASEKILTTLKEEAAGCTECGGGGTVSYWNEVAYFEDRRACTRCEAGRKIDSRLGDIVKRAQLEERLSGR